MPNKYYACPKCRAIYKNYDFTMQEGKKMMSLDTALKNAKILVYKPDSWYSCTCADKSSLSWPGLIELKDVELLDILYG